VTRDRLRGLFIQEPPKTDAGHRTIALPPYTLDLVRRRLAPPTTAADPAVIFPSPKGLLRDPNNTSGDVEVSRQWRFGSTMWSCGSAQCRLDE
jgi:hypothetical protein